MRLGRTTSDLGAKKQPPSSEILISLHPTDSELTDVLPTTSAHVGEGGAYAEPSCVGSSNSVPPFEEIVRLYQRDVRFYVARFLGRDTAADDVAQEVFVQVYRSLSQFSGRGSLKSWILGIARHLVGTWFRQQNRQIHFRAGDIELELVHCRWQEWQRETKSDVLSGFATPEVDTELELQWLRGCMEKLKAPQRKLVQQFYFESESAEEIGRQIGRNSGAVRMALLRIREALAKCIRQQAARSRHHE